MILHTTSVHSDIGISETVHVLNGKTIFDAMKTMGLYWHQRREDWDLFFEDRNMIALINIDPCGHSHDCCGCVCGVRMTFGRVADVWICHERVTYNV